MVTRFGVWCSVLCLALPAARAQEAGLALTLSNRFLNAGFAHPVEKVTPVNVTIQKYHIVGSARLNGHMTFEPLLSATDLRLRMTLSGTAVGCDTSHVRKLQVHTVDHSRVCLQQEVIVDGLGVRAGAATVSAPTVSQFQSATAGKPPVRDALVRGLARSQFRLLPGKSNRIATEVSEMVLRQEMDRGLPVLLGKANTGFREQFLEVLSGFEIPVENVHFSSTDDAVVLQIAVPGIKAPALPATNHGDLTIRIHEAVLNRLARQLYGGSTQIGKDLEHDLSRGLQLLGGAAAPPGSAATAWSITFAKEAPITFRFANNTIHVAIHGDEFEVGTDQYKAMTAVLQYDLSSQPNGWLATRNQPIVVSPPGAAPGTPPTPRQQFLRGYLVAKLGKVFPKVLDLSRLVLPEALGKAAQARVSHVATDNGWLTIEMRLD